MYEPLSPCAIVDSGSSTDEKGRKTHYCCSIRASTLNALFLAQDRFRAPGTLRVKKGCMATAAKTGTLSSDFIPRWFAAVASRWLRTTYSVARTEMWFMVRL